MNRSSAVRLIWIALFSLTIATAVPAAAQAPRAAPPNDNFAGRTVVNTRKLMNGSFTVGSAQDATVASGSLPPEPAPSCSGGTLAFFDSVWFELRAAYDVELVIDTYESSLNGGTSNDTVIAVYSGSVASPTSFSQLTERYCSSGPSNGAGSFTWLPLTHGTYYLQVGSQDVLTSASSYQVEFGSRYQLLSNTSFGTATAQLSPWKLKGPGSTNDKVKCGIAFPRVVDECSFRFKTSATENSSLTYQMTDVDDVPHDTGPTRYSEFHLIVSATTERAQTDATAMIKMKFADGTKQKDSRSLDAIGAIDIDPLTGSTPTKMTVKIKHTGKSGKPLYIISVKVYYAPGATGRDAAPLPLPPL